ncbi:MAG: helix-turn-helix domain-containing protein, partial [Pseudomonadota bacterium]
AEKPRLDTADFAHLTPGVSRPDAPSHPEQVAANSLPLTDAAGHVRPLAEIEAAALDFALERYDGQMSEAARRLGIGRSTLYRKTQGEA